MNKRFRAFTVIELLIVISIVAILSSLFIVAYSGLVSKSSAASLQSDLTNNSKKIKLYSAQYGSFPTSIDLGTGCPTAPVSISTSDFCLKTSSTNSITSYVGNSSFYTLKISGSGLSYVITEASSPVSNVDGVLMQTVTSANCPIALTRAVDARDNHSYWIKKLADGKCWMLTNLAYAGGGTNTYGDRKTLSNGTNDSTMTYTSAKYYIVPTTTNFTSEPNAPSTSTDGTGQYGYLYNFCAANGVQATAACANSFTPSVNTNVSICPFGWKLPVGDSNGDFDNLIKIVNGSTSQNDNGLLNGWFAQWSGKWAIGFVNQGSSGYFWSSTDLSPYAYGMQTSSAGPTASYFEIKSVGYAVRCLAN